MKNNKLFFLAITMLVGISGFAQNMFWTQKGYDVNSLSNSLQRAEIPTNEIAFELDLENFKDALNNVTNRKESNYKKGVSIFFPYSDGSFNLFEVFEAPVMHKDLQNKYPGIKSYVGRKKDNPREVIRFSLSSRGLNAIVLNSSLGTQYIDCVTKDKKVYTAYKLSDVPMSQMTFQCLTEDIISENSSIDNNTTRNADDAMLREYSLALACTEEYAQYHVTLAGLNNGTEAQKKAAVLSVMNDIMTRVNAVFEVDLSVTMVLIPTNENIIFIESPFLTNDNLGELIDESQQFITTFADSPFDIGHMLADTSGGLAQVGSVCNSSGKARAASGTFGVPSGLVHENVIRHEMGHQFGALHTYNSNNCAGPPTASSAYEPGGGTTVMSYAGICGTTSNIIPTNDLYFHQISLQQMWFRISNDFNCSDNRSTRNDEPVVDAGADYVIPVSTPYKLTGSATDDEPVTALTYCWEQYDLGDPGLPTTTSLNGPIVRSFPPTASNVRYIPRLEDYYNDINNSTDWEKLSLVARDINFRLTVRDNDIDGGQVGFDTMTITTSTDSGPFEVTSQNTSGTTLPGGSIQTVTWNIANTNSGAVNESSVNILLSVDGGNTFTEVLATATLNDGIQDITLPNETYSDCRIMVEASNNIFYNINTESFNIRRNNNLSINDNEFSNSILMYPNPSENGVYIDFENQSQENVTINIFDITGKEVLVKSFENSFRFKEYIKLDGFSSGLYLVKINNGISKGIKKLIIK